MDCGGKTQCSAERVGITDPTCKVKRFPAFADKFPVLFAFDTNSLGVFGAKPYERFVEKIRVVIEIIIHARHLLPSKGSEAYRYYSAFGCM
jgi:hypothetical protein